MLISLVGVRLGLLWDWFDVAVLCGVVWVPWRFSLWVGVLYLDLVCGLVLLLGCLWYGW